MPSAARRPNRTERRAARQRLGPLTLRLVAPRTRTRYNTALQRFFLYLDRFHEHRPNTVARIEAALCRFINDLWENGDPMSYAADTLSAIQLRSPMLRRRLPRSWQLIGAWKKAEIPSRATPFLHSFVTAVAACIDFTFGESIAILLAFHCLHRTGEFMQVRWKDLTIGGGASRGVLRLLNTKSGQRFGCTESIVISDTLLLQCAGLCFYGCARKSALDNVASVGGSPRALRVSRAARAGPPAGVGSALPRLGVDTRLPDFCRRFE